MDVDVDAVQLEKGDKATDFVPSAELEFGLEPSAPGGIFEEGQDASLIVRAIQRGAVPARATVAFEGTDFFGKLAVLPELALEAEAFVERGVKIPADWRGYYHIRARAQGGTRPLAADVRIAIVPRRTTKDTVLGINHAFATAGLIDLASKAGVSWYRDWSMKWEHIEPAQGQFHWEVSDAQIGRVLQRGVHVLPLLPPFPSSEWASEAPTTAPTTRYPGVRLRQAWAPKDPAAMASFIERAVERYRGRIGVWEFLNEPIYTDYALPSKEVVLNSPGPRYEVADYVRLLGVAAAAMKKADPNCRVIGGISGGPGTHAEEVIQAGALKHLDIFNIPMYPGARPPEPFADAMRKVLRAMDAAGGRKPIWITEFSYYGTDDPPRRPFFILENSWPEQRLLESERQCAEYTVRYFAVMMSCGVEKIFIHSGATGRVNDPSLECALFDYGGAPRKLFPALAVFTELMGPAPTFAGGKKIGESGHAAAFETGRNAVLVLWQEEDSPLSATIPAVDGLTCMDMMGWTIPAAAGKPLPLSTSPIYLRDPAGAAKNILQLSSSSK